MNILKAFLLFALLIGLEGLMSLGVYEIYKFIEPNVTDSISSNSLIHYFRITNTMIIAISYLVVFFFFFKTVFDWNQGIEKVKIIDLKTISFLIIIAVGLELFDTPFFDFSKIIDHINDVEIETFNFSESSNISLFYKAISALIIAPILEELFFRKFIFGELLKKNSLSLSIIISSICFSLIHLPSYRNLLPTFILGVICCIIYLKTKNIIYPIILHFFTNLSWLVLLTYGKPYQKWIYGLEYNFIYWTLPIAGAAISYIGLNRIKAANNGEHS